MAKDPKNWQRFKKACEQNDLNKVAMILSERGDVNCKFWQHLSPLHIATWNNSCEVAEFLLNKGADPDARNMQDQTPIYHAVYSGYEEFVSLLIKHKADVNAEDYDGKSVLHAAVDTGNENIVRLLLSNGADPNQTSDDEKKIIDYDWTKPVLITAVGKNFVKIVELLINYGADVNAESHFRETAILFAIANANVAMFKLLLRNGANIKSNADLLNLAVYVNCKEIVELLLDSGIDVNSVDSNYRTAFSLVAAKEDWDFDETMSDYDVPRNRDFKRLEILKLLLRRGINVNHPCASQLVTLHWAAEMGYVQLVEALLENNPDVNAQDRLDRTALYLSTDAIISRMLIRNGADVNIANRRGETPLHAAAKMGDTKIVETLLQFNANVNAQDKLHRTPLDFSTNEIVSRMLLQNGADPNLVCKSGETALHVAVQKGHVDIVEALLKFKPDINALDEEGRTTLHRSTNVIVSQILLRHGANVNVANKRGETPLHVALQMENNEIAEALLDFKPDVNARDKLLRTPLHLCKNEDIVRMLIQNGADVNVANKSGETPLHLAARRGLVKIAEVLLASGADPNAQDEDEETPLHQSTKAVITRMLLEKGADVNACTCRRDTPLHVAAHRGYTEIAQILLEYKADVNLTNMKNATPLHHSVQSGKVAMSEMLLKRGAAVNAKYRDGKTPLHTATTKGYPELVTLLLNYEADINCPDRGGKTPIFYAVKPERFNIFMILLAHDPNINHYVQLGRKYSVIEWIENVNQYNGHIPMMHDAVVDHIMKVQALHQSVSDNLEVMDNNVQLESDFHNNLKEEIGKMRQHRIGNTNVSLYDLLTKNFTQIATYIVFNGKASDFEASQSTITEDSFPLYYYMIVCKFEKVKSKAISWNHSEKCLVKILPQWLPLDVTEMVFSYLEDGDLRNLSQIFIECFED